MPSVRCPDLFVSNFDLVASPSVFTSVTSASLSCSLEECLVSFPSPGDPRRWGPWMRVPCFLLCIAFVLRRPFCGTGQSPRCLRPRFGDQIQSSLHFISLTYYIPGPLLQGGSVLTWRCLVFRCVFSFYRVSGHSCFMWVLLATLIGTYVASLGLACAWAWHISDHGLGLFPFMIFTDKYGNINFKMKITYLNTSHIAVGGVSSSSIGRHGRRPEQSSGPSMCPSSTIACHFTISCP